MKKNNLINPEYPRKPKRLSNETDEQFEQRIAHHKQLRKAWEKEYKKARYQNNSGVSKKIKSRQNDWYKANASIINLKKRQRYADNPYKVLIYNKNYRDIRNQDIEFVRETNRSAKNNYYRRISSDPQFVARRSLRGLFNSSIASYLNGKKNNSVLELIGCNVEKFVEHIENQFAGGMSWTPKNFHLDHIRPCSSFDLTDPEQIKECYHYTNFQPLWPKDNLQKSNKLDWKKNELSR